jgi:hypothetical protein
MPLVPHVLPSRDWKNTSSATNPVPDEFYTIKYLECDCGRAWSGLWHIWEVVDEGEPVVEWLAGETEYANRKACSSVTASATNLIYIYIYIYICSHPVLNQVIAMRNQVLIAWSVTCPHLYLTDVLISVGCCSGCYIRSNKTKVMNTCFVLRFRLITLLTFPALCKTRRCAVSRSWPIRVVCLTRTHPCAFDHPIRECNPCD